MPRKKSLLLEVPCLRVRQSKRKYIYVFSYEGKQIPRIANVAHAGRGSKAKLKGYQRPEQNKHIQGIRQYIDSPGSIIPNAVVIGFDRRVKFVPAKGEMWKTKWQTLGKLVLPRLEDGEPLAGRIVDGQQRIAAVREARAESYPMPIVAFIAEDEKEQREQFILVNSSKPLQRGLLHELAPHTDVMLPDALHRKRRAATLVEMLNHTEGSPLYHRIRTPTSPTGNIKDNSMLRMLDNSMSEGALRFFARTERESEDSYKLLSRFWSAVAEVFPTAWDRAPKESRLVHGAGIISMGTLLDAVASESASRGKLTTQAMFVRSLRMVEDQCAWTGGTWDLPSGPRRWNEIQNTRQDIEMLREHLQEALLEAGGGRQRRRRSPRTSAAAR